MICDTSTITQTLWTNLTGEESLEAEDVGWGLDGAENIGQEGECGEVGLGDVALMDTHTQNDALTSDTVHAYYFWTNDFYKLKAHFPYMVGMLPRLFGLSLQT